MPGGGGEAGRKANQEVRVKPGLEEGYVGCQATCMLAVNEEASKLLEVFVIAAYK